MNPVSVPAAGPMFKSKHSATISSWGEAIGLGIAATAVTGTLAPAIPSNTARAGGIIFPLLKATARAYGSEPEDGTAHKIGAWDTLMWFAALVMMATFLNNLGLIPWFAKTTGGLVSNINWMVCHKWRRGMDYSWHVQHLLREFGCGQFADLRSDAER